MSMCPILGTLVPLFWISCDVSSEFPSRSGFCLNSFVFLRRQMYCSFHACAEVRIGSGSNRQSPTQKTNVLLFYQRPSHKWRSHMYTYKYTGFGLDGYLQIWKSPAKTDHMIITMSIGFNLTGGVTLDGICLKPGHIINYFHSIAVSE